MKLKIVFLSALFLLSIGIPQQILAQNKDLIPYPAARNERFVIQALRQIVGAQATYQGTTGAGNFGSLAQLGQENLIDPALAGGEKYGYLFTVTTQDRTSTVPANFQAVAIPRLYRRSGIRSFYVDSTALIRGADKQGAPANQSDPPIVEEYSCGSIDECEANVITSLRRIVSAEATYQSIYGSGNFGSLCQLGQAGLIDEISAGGEKYGYYFVISRRDRGNNVSAMFEAIAIPRRYNQTGRRSFFTDESGVMRAADHNGAPANVDDPPVK